MCVSTFRTEITVLINKVNLDAIVIMQVNQDVTWRQRLAILDILAGIMESLWDQKKSYLTQC